MKKRFMIYRLNGQFFILPCVGVIMHFRTEYRPRIAVAWLWWSVSFGLGRRLSDYGC